MTTQQNGAQTSGAGDFSITRLAERLGLNARTATIYGEPVERDGVTVIPVARARWMFGGGGGTGRSAEGQGSGTGAGGGGLVNVTPAGYIEIKNGSSEFRRIHDPAGALVAVPVILAAGIAALLILRGIRRLLRG